MTSKLLGKKLTQVRQELGELTNLERQPVDNQSTSTKTLFKSFEESEQVSSEMVGHIKKLIGADIGKLAGFKICEKLWCSESWRNIDVTVAPLSASVTDMDESKQTTNDNDASYYALAQGESSEERDLRSIIDEAVAEKAETEKILLEAERLVAEAGVAEEKREKMKKAAKKTGRALKGGSTEDILALRREVEEAEKKVAEQRRELAAEDDVMDWEDEGLGETENYPMMTYRSDMVLNIKGINEM